MLQLINGHNHCMYCSKEYSRETRICTDCNQKILNPIHRGHNRKMKNIHFDKLDQKTEVLQTLKNMELAGQLNTPEKMAIAESKREEVLSKPQVIIDYQVHGHPNFDKDFKHPEFIKYDD